MMKRLVCCCRPLCVSSVWVFFAGWPMPAFGQAPPADDLRVEKIVLLMRHGVRAGTAREQVMRVSERTWPDFGHAEGELTAHGRAALMLWGQYWRRRLAMTGLLPISGSLQPNAINAIASVEPRTRDSADVFLGGLSPGSGFRVAHADTMDLFVPAWARAGLVDPDRVKEVVIDALGMPLESAEAFYRPSIALLEQQLGMPPGCLSSKPWRIQAGSWGVRIAPLDLIEIMIETVRMQYLNNLPMQDVGFGGVQHLAALSQLMLLRKVHYDATRHPRYFAARQGLPLLENISDLLWSGTNTNASGSQPGGALVTLFVGHESNLASLRSILGFDWKAPDHVANDPIPGGLLLFERLRHRVSGERFVRISYHSPTQDQIRHLFPLGDASMPFVAGYAPPSALAAPGTDLIPLRRFHTLVAELAAEIEPEPSHPSSKTTSRPRRPVGATNPFWK